MLRYLYLLVMWNFSIVDTCYRRTLRRQLRCTILNDLILFLMYLKTESIRIEEKPSRLIQAKPKSVKYMCEPSQCSGNRLPMFFRSCYCFGQTITLSAFVIHYFIIICLQLTFAIKGDFVVSPRKTFSISRFSFA